MIFKLSHKRYMQFPIHRDKKDGRIDFTLQRRSLALTADNIILLCKELQIRVNYIIVTDIVVEDEIIKDLLQEKCGEVLWGDGEALVSVSSQKVESVIKQIADKSSYDKFSYGLFDVDDSIDFLKKFQQNNHWDFPHLYVWYYEREMWYRFDADKQFTNLNYIQLSGDYKEYRGKWF